MSSQTRSNCQRNPRCSHASRGRTRRALVKLATVSFELLSADPGADRRPDRRTDASGAPDALPLPLWLVTENRLAAWLEAQPAGVAAWARQHQFAAERHRVLALPGADGRIAAAVLGLGPLASVDDLTPWHAAGLAGPAAARQPGSSRSRSARWRRRVSPSAGCTAATVIRRYRSAAGAGSRARGGSGRPARHRRRRVALGRARLRDGTRPDQRAGQRARPRRARRGRGDAGARPRRRVPLPRRPRTRVRELSPDPCRGPREPPRHRA